MKILAPSFSQQYLKQVHDEWLYVQAMRRSQNQVYVVNDPESGEASYSFSPLLRADKESRQSG